MKLSHTNQIDTHRAVQVRSLLSVLLLVLPIVFARPLLAANAASERPNVVLIMTDDQGYGDLSVTGNPVVKTPHIDELARGAASLSSFYVSPVCSPTRACLMTGRYNYRTRCIDTYLGRSMMDPAEVTIAEVLQGAGYATGIFGKWHLGDNYPLRAIDQGFEEALVHKGGGLAQPADPPENNRRYTDAVLFHNGRQVNTKGYCTDVYFDGALKWIDKSIADDRNFFIYVPTNAPHGPFHDVPKQWYDHFKSVDLSPLLPEGFPARRRDDELDKLARIFAMIANVDDNVGRLTKHLADRQLTDNTIVIFMVDNGPNSMRYVAGMKGMKSHVHDGGIHSPFFIHWPARLKAGHSSDRIAAHIDLLPTLAEACGAALPDNLKLDGRSVLPLLRGDDVKWADRTLFIQSHRGDAPVRYHHFAARSQRWKLLHASGFGSETFSGSPKFELYDMQADPGEQNNLAGERPEIVNQLKDAYDAWFDDVGSTRPDNYAPPHIHLGTAHERPVVLTRQDWRRTSKDGGWNRDSLGHWELSVAEPRKYDVRFRFTPNKTEGFAELKIAGQTLRQPLAPGAESCTFTGVELPAGPARLEAVLTHEMKPHGVYQADVDWSP